MDYGQFSKLMVMHFIIACVITLIVGFVLSTVKIDNLAYLGVLFGLYIFSVYGVDRLVDEKLIENNYQRFVLAIVCIIIFYLFFTYLMPYMFDMNVFMPIRLGEGMVFDSQSVFIIFSAVVLIVNYFNYR